MRGFARSTVICRRKHFIYVAVCLYTLFTTSKITGVLDFINEFDLKSMSMKVTYHCLM